MIKNLALVFSAITALRKSLRIKLLGLLVMVVILWIKNDNATGETVQTTSIYVIDGGTVKIDGQTFRLMGFDTPETYRAECAAEKALGEAATNRLRELLASHTEATLFIADKRDKYGRGLAELKLGGRDVGQVLISEGLARPYDGGKRLGWCS